MKEYILRLNGLLITLNVRKMCKMNVFLTQFSFSSIYTDQVGTSTTFLISSESLSTSREKSFQLEHSRIEVGKSNHI